ncbi:MAG: ribonuclease toxin HepT-like protein [Desulfotomaculales bacterium]
MNPLRARTREGILSLVGQVDHVMKALRVTVDEAVLKAREFSRTTPTPFDLRGIGSLLHDFYTAIEDVFEAIPGDLNGDLSDGLAWHKQLLARMSIPAPKLRPAVISEELRWKLDEYLRFRYVFRNVYGYMLDWERLQPLLAKMDKVYRQFGEEIASFRSFLMRLADELN